MTMIEGGTVRGLANIKAFRQQREDDFQARKNRAERPKTDWFGMEPGETVRILPLQEFDMDSPNYSEKNGLAFFAIEHSHPKAYWRKALCTIEDEGRCLGCERVAEDKAWKQKVRMYLNVAVENGDGGFDVKLLSQGDGPKSITPVLLDGAEEYGSISNRLWKVTRVGTKDMQNTSYTTLPGKETDINVEDFDIIDIDQVLYKIPYDKQEQHFTLKGETAERVEEPVVQSATSDDDLW